MDLQRSFAVVALTATAGIHSALVPDHLREAPYAGGLFIALSAASLLVAILLVARGDRLAWATGGALALAAMLAYAASRSVGLPSLGDDVGDWLNPLGVAALLCELTVALLSCDALLRNTMWSRRRPSAGILSELASLPAPNSRR
jgi:hypothetical protein